jgi:hypothetical protein
MFKDEKDFSAPDFICIYKKCLALYQDGIECNLSLVFYHLNNTAHNMSKAARTHS